MTSEEMFNELGYYKSDKSSDDLVFYECETGRGTCEISLGYGTVLCYINGELTGLMYPEIKAAAKAIEEMEEMKYD